MTSRPERRRGRRWSRRWALLTLGLILGVGGTGVGLAAQEEPRAADETLSGLDAHMPAPAYGPDTQAMVALGSHLFRDPVLSRDTTFSCASCHRPDIAFTDGLPVSVGVFDRRGTRNVPTLLNRGWGRSFFWDGRTPTLEEQVLKPVTAPAEMDMSVSAAVDRIAGSPGYRRRFREAFGGEVGEEELARALAAYVRSIRAGASRFDRFVEGEVGALSDREIRGMELFQGRARCARCHFGPLLTDESFHNTGVEWRNGAPADSGRAVVTGRERDIGAFKTPTLREIARTAPYMHDGSMATLEEVVDFYDDGGHPNPHLDERIQPLGLDAREKAALVAFLRALEGRIVEGGAGR